MSEVKDFLKANKQLLINNNLEGLYLRAGEDYNWSELIPGITAFLYENGINPFEYIDFVPEWAFTNLDILKLPIVNDGTLVLPDNVTGIDTCAFSWAAGFHTVDLRGIQYINRSAFIGSSVKNLIFDDKMKLNTISAIAFDRCTIEKILFPKDSFDQMVEAFKSSAVYESSDREFKKVKFEYY